MGPQAYPPAAHLSLAVSCPICKLTSASHVLQGYEIYLARSGETKKVGTGLAAFRCEGAGHVFFVRAEDLERKAP